MEKVVIIGSSGAGKSTLARKLGPILKIKVVHLDRLFWRRDWEKIPRDTRIEILEKLVMDSQWIIEGTYPLSSDPVLDRADTIIFLDMHPLLCLWRVIKRHYEKHNRRRDLREGCSDKLDWNHIWNVLTFPYRGKKTFEQMLSNCQPGQAVRWLHSPEEVEEFLARQVPTTDDKRNSSNRSVLVGATTGS